jgi:hypothetical protein
MILVGFEKSKYILVIHKSRTWKNFKGGVISKHKRCRQRKLQDMGRNSGVRVSVDLVSHENSDN